MKNTIINKNLYSSSIELYKGGGYIYAEPGNITGTVEFYSSCGGKTL